MKRWERPLLLFSIALNVGFVSLAAVRHEARTTPVETQQWLQAPDSPRAAQRVQHWQRRRHEAMGRALGLDAAQRRHAEASFEELRPALRDARRDVVTRRLAFGQALAQGDAAAARDAQREISRAQARLDSLCAEAMLDETATLRPEQRQRYVTWTFRHGPAFGPGGGFGPGARPPHRPGFGPPPHHGGTPPTPDGPDHPAPETGGPGPDAGAGPDPAPGI